MLMTAPRPHKVRHEPRRRPVEVMRVGKLSPNFVSVTFGGEALADFRSDGFDDHVKFILSTEAGEELRRDYTPRGFDPARRELTLEFDLHSKGEAGAWARRAAPGAQAIIAGPKSSMVIPTDYEWLLLAGDETALPAITRRLEESPAGARVIALIKLADAADRRVFDTQAQAKVIWLAPDADIAAELRALELPSRQGFVWCAGESSAMARVRDVVLVEKQHPHELARIASYWKINASGAHEVLS
jgi:NADPH-dependent ferric siderophore reductase